ncbi:hypothetical protein RAS2_28400 [Phycisphaerae bacterium RAS2]|nr:hypothetical protein RAS2_28400 [Phycisphaerae bacterium RAS2]
MQAKNFIVLVGGAFVLAAATLLLGDALASKETMAAQRPGPSGTPNSEKPSYTHDGKLIAPSANVYREWVFIGSPVTPNDMNDGEASFPEFHNVYINPTAWKEWKKSGVFPEGTYMVKELSSVGTKKATSGNGYFQGEFTGLEASIKDTKRYPAEAKGWGYYSFGHAYPLAREAAVQDFAKCARCHVGNAAEDMVFAQYYPPIRAAKGKGN